MRVFGLVGWARLGGLFQTAGHPLPWVPRGRIENLRGSRRLAAPPLFHWVPAALAAAPRQGSRRPFGPSAGKSVTTHFLSGLFGPRPCLRRALPSFWSIRSGLWVPLASRRAPRKTRVSCGPHAISSPRPVTRPQASSAFRANPIKFAPNRLERPKPCETPPPLRAPRGGGL